MKKYLYISILIIFSSSLNVGQNFFPIKNESKILRQYERNYYRFIWGSGSTGSLDIQYDSTFVSDSLIFEGKTFYNYFNNYYYYDIVQQKLFILDNNQIKTAVDFTSPQGSVDTLYIDNIEREYFVNGIYIDSVYGTNRNCFAVTHSYEIRGSNLGYPYRRWEHKYIFADSVGFYKKIFKYKYDFSPDDISNTDTTWINIIVDLGNNKFSELPIPRAEDITLISDRKIFLQWSSRRVLEGFVIERKTDQEITYQPIDTVSSSVFSYYDNTVEAGYKYYYRIRTLKWGFVSDPSSVMSVLNLYHPGFLSPDTSQIGKITVSWDSLSAIFDGAILERRYWINEKPWTFIWSPLEIIDTFDISTTSYSDTSVSIAPYFSYRLRAFKDSLFSPYTPLIVVTPFFPEPAKPKNIKFDSIGVTQNIISWQSSDVFASYFAIERKELDPPGEFRKLLDTFALDTVFIDQQVTSGIEYAYRVKAIFAHRHSDYSDTIYTTITSIDEIKQPISFCLEQNYPNPFNPETEIIYSIPKTAFVNISVFDVLGKRITTLVNEEKISGKYKVKWRAEDFPSGIYFYRLQSKEFSEVKKMLLIK